MGFFGHSRANAEVRPEAKWDYIQLNDFKATNFFTYIAYGYLYVSLFISVAVYAVDTFTAVQLLVFNKWSSEIQPAISFDVTKWIFSVCIILSFVNLGYEHIRAQMIIRRGSVAESFLDSLAVRLQCIRICGSGKGWRRFLVFAELTKSKKGAEYIALFTYFSFQAWIRIIFCSGPRQVINAVTLYSVYTAKLQVDGGTFEHSLESLFAKIKVLAEEDFRQALILSGMLFTLVIWVFSALCFILAILFFVFFLWSWIPKEDGGLAGYCERKTNKRVMKIVSAKVNAAIADQERQRKKAEWKAAKKTGAMPPEERKATLPTFMTDDSDKLPDMPALKRADTEQTLPAYTSRPGTPKGGFELNRMPPMPSRTDTTWTNGSNASRAPLLGQGAEMGQASPSYPSPAYGLSRNGTMSSIKSPTGHPGLTRVQTNGSNYSGSTLHRAQTSDSSSSGYFQSQDDDLPPMPQTVRSPAPTSASVGPYGVAPRSTPGPRQNWTPSNEANFMPQPMRSPTSSTMGPYGMPPRSTPTPGSAYDDYNRSASPAPFRSMPPRSEYDDYTSVVDDYAPTNRASPGPSQMSSRPAYQDPTRPMGPSYGQGQDAYSGPGGYPHRSQTGPVPQRVSPGQPQRSMTTTPVGQPRYQSPGPFQNQPSIYQNPPPQDYFNRPGTAQSQRGMQGPPQPQRQLTNQSSHSRLGNGFPELESQRGTPGPRY
ncbi:unnamed protein product [Discula destructiva]